MRLHRSLSLRVNFAWTFTGNVVYAACQWAMLVVLVRFGSAEITGQYALGLAFATPVFMFANLQLRQIQATDAQQTFHVTDYLSLRIVATALALLVVYGLVILAGYHGQTQWVILLVAGAKAVEALSDVLYGRNQQQERLDRVAQSLILRGGLGLTALLAGLLAPGGLVTGLLLLIVAWAAVLFCFDLPAAGLARGELRRLPQPDALVGLLRLGAPLGVGMLLLALNAAVPRFVVGQLMGVSALGIFAAIAYIERAGTTVVGALGQAAGPRLARYHAAADTAACRRLLNRMLAIGGLLGGGGLLVALTCGGSLLGQLYGAAYVQVDVFGLVMLAAGLWYLASFLGYATTALRLIRWQPLILLAATLVSLASSLLLVPHYGLVGAALAMLLAAACALAGYLALVLPPLYGRRCDAQAGRARTTTDALPAAAAAGGTGRSAEPDLSPLRGGRL